MSVVTEVLIITSSADDQAIGWVNQHLETSRGPQHLEKVGSWRDMGGPNSTMSQVYGAGYDYVTPEDLIDILRKAPWKDPRSVVAWILHEANQHAEVWTPQHGLIVKSEFSF